MHDDRSSFSTRVINVPREFRGNISEKDWDRLERKLRAVENCKERPEDGHRKSMGSGGRRSREFVPWC